MLVTPENKITEYVFQKSAKLKKFLKMKKRVHFCGTCQNDEKEMGTLSYDVCDSKDLDELQTLLNDAERTIEMVGSESIKTDPNRKYHFIFLHM